MFRKIQLTFYVYIVVHSSRVLVQCNEFNSSDEYYANVLQCDSLTSKGRIDCSSRGIVDLNLIQFHQDSYDVNFSGNEIKALKSGTFVSTSNVHTLDLSHNVIDFVSSNVFENLTNLHTLDLSSNKLYQLPLDAFGGLTTLIRLNLRHNNLADIDPEHFKPTVQVRWLNLGRNRLNFISENVLSHLASLEHLDLEDCQLSSLPDKLFQHNHRLRELLLAKNPFDLVPNSALQSAQNSLSVLDLSSTHITIIQNADFAGLVNLTELHICHSIMLETIGEHAFRDQDKLEQLMCEFNSNLKKIDPKAFRSPANGQLVSEKLTDVSLKGNSLTTLDKHLLPWSKLSALDLTLNPWRCDCYLRWMKELNVSILDQQQDLMTCAQPGRHLGDAISKVDIKDFKCPLFDTDIALVGSVLVIVSLSMALTILGYMFVRKQICQQLSNLLSPDRKDGGYVRVVPGRDQVDLEWDHTGEPTVKSAANGT
ncbi:Carboxypeptidase N subunit 2 [Halotydeus destructor]|nr:Carboxypeptidase N subunit 2 [Halotydeus destructor]